MASALTASAVDPVFAVSPPVSGSPRLRSEPRQTRSPSILPGASQVGHLMHQPRPDYVPLACASNHYRSAAPPPLSRRTAPILPPKTLPNRLNSSVR